MLHVIAFELTRQVRTVQNLLHVEKISKGRPENSIRRKKRDLLKKCHQH
jgi:hypothetical protein